MPSELTGSLDLTDAWTKIERAKELHRELVAALAQWEDSRGVEAQSRRTLQFACYIGFAKVNAAPQINLPMRAGEVLHALRTALDYTAFQIYLAAGGTPDGPDAHKVAFPIVTDPAKWDRVVASKVPHAWPAAVVELRGVQQFAPVPANQPSPLASPEPLLTRLAALGGTDKHRNLTLFAAGAWSASAIAPEPGPWYSTIIQIAVPGPLLPTTPGPKVEVSRVFLQPSPAPSHDAALTWDAGVQFERPDPPQLKFGFRANDGTEIEALQLPEAIDLVETILRRFSMMPGPS